MKCGCGRPRPLLLLLALVSCWSGPALWAQPDADRVFLVHLPSLPIEAGNRQAEAVTALAAYLKTAVPGLGETKIFRRLSDAQTFLAAAPARVTLLWCDASFLLDLPAGADFVPLARVIRGGVATYRRHLVVRADRSDLRELADLRGKSLSVVEAAAPRGQALLGRAVFEGELDLATWFGPLTAVADDFAATANVLYGETDAALVAEFNPLLNEQLEQQKLRSLYTSPPLSLPVLAGRRGALTADERSALDTALRQLGQVQSPPVLAGLKIDGFAALAGERIVQDQLLPAAVRKKTLEIAVPRAALVELAAPKPLPQELQLILAVELPEIPLATFETLVPEKNPAP